MKNQILALILFVFIFDLHGQTNDSKPTQVASKAKVYNIKTYGAVGDSITMDTKAIQVTIDACNENGGGTVWVPVGKYHIGTIQLKSNVTLSLDYGAYLLGSVNIADYDTDITKAREGFTECLIFAENATNITIEGLGIIDGRGSSDNFFRGKKRPWNPRPRLMRMQNCTNVKLSGVTYKRPAFWGLHLIDCKNLHIDAIKLEFRNNNYNNDGLDIDGCEDVLIENCDINAGDDAICLKSSLNQNRNFVIRNCIISSNTAAVKFGTSSHGGFVNIKITNCYFNDCPMGAIKLQLVDGGTLENIDISRIVMEDVGNPIFIRLGNRSKSWVKKDTVPVGTLRNVRISDVVATVTRESPEKTVKAVYKNLDVKKLKSDPEKLLQDQKTRTGPIMITGIPGCYVEDVVLENVKISYPGGGSEEDAEIVVPEDENAYPEQYKFGVLPSWGAYIRHAKNITFKNVTLTTREHDAREMIITDDVEGFVNK